MRLRVLLPSEPPNLFCSQISLNRGSASPFSPLFKAAFFLELVFSRLTRVIPSPSGIVLDTGLGDCDMQLTSYAKCLEGKHFIHYMYITNMTYRRIHYNLQKIRWNAFPKPFFSVFYTIFSGEEMGCAFSRYEGEIFIQYFSGETWGKETTGRSRRRWKGSIKIYLQKIGGRVGLDWPGSG